MAVPPPGATSALRARQSCSGEQLAGRAQAPVGHLGLVDVEAVGEVGVEAGGGADGAVDVGDDSAAAADDVVVVVSRARFIAGRRSGWLDAPGEPGSGQGTEDVIDGLGGDRLEPAARLPGDLFDFQMATVAKNVEHGETRLGHSKTALAKQILTGLHAVHFTRELGPIQENYVATW